MAAKVVPRRPSRSHDRNASSGMSVRVLDCKIHAVKEQCKKIQGIRANCRYRTKVLTSAMTSALKFKNPAVTFHGGFDRGFRRNPAALAGGVWRGNHPTPKR